MLNNRVSVQANYLTHSLLIISCVIVIAVNLTSNSSFHICKMELKSSSGLLHK